jgi:hypothetical protein
MPKRSGVPLKAYLGDCIVETTIIIVARPQSVGRLCPASWVMGFSPLVVQAPTLTMVDAVHSGGDGRLLRCCPSPGPHLRLMSIEFTNEAPVQGTSQGVAVHHRYLLLW